MDQEIGVCPFFPQHKMTKHRLPYHIVKCEKNYFGVPLERCPFNANHLFASGKRGLHFETCIDYQQYEVAKYQEKNGTVYLQE